jgi:hypothetical protein
VVLRRDAVYSGTIILEKPAVSTFRIFGMTIACGFSETICKDKMEAAGPYEILLTVYQSTLRHIPEDRNLNLKYLG